MGNSKKGEAKPKKTLSAHAQTLPPVTTEESIKGGQQSQVQQPPDVKDIPVKQSRIREILHFFSRSEWVNVFLTAVIAGTGVVGIFLVIRSGKDTQKMITAMQTSADAAQRQSVTSARELELSQRPWITAKFAPVDRVWIDQDGMHLTIEMNAKNVGQSPAVRVEYEFAIMSFPPNIYATRDELCKTVELRSALKSNGKFLQTWFPGDASPVAATITLQKANFFAPEKDRQMQSVAMPIVAVCIAYSPSFKDVEYHTGYILSLHHVSNSKETFIPNRQWQAPANEFYLSEQFGTGVDAK